MNVEVFLTSANLAEEDVRDRTVVIIDVLRASATILTALHHGARDIVPVADMAEAGKLASSMDQSSYLLGGERGGNRIEGYHLGNSPLEYTEEVVKGHTIIFTTTNGTQALSRCRAARHLLVGSFLNAQQVVDFIKQADTDVAIVCAGRRNRVSLEDSLCAGLLLYRLWDGQLPTEVSDTAYMTFTQYSNDKDDLISALSHCNHAQWLTENGYGEDVAYCIEIDALPLLPYYKENRLVPYDASLLEATASVMGK